jgi:hypothetical protein
MRDLLEETEGDPGLAAAAPPRACCAGSAAGGVWEALGARVAACVATLAGEGRKSRSRRGDCRVELRREPAREPAGGSIAIVLVTGARRLDLEAITAARPNRDTAKGKARLSGPNPGSCLSWSA